MSTEHSSESSRQSSQELESFEFFSGHQQQQRDAAGAPKDSVGKDTDDPDQQAVMEVQAEMDLRIEATAQPTADSSATSADANLQHGDADAIEFRVVCPGDPIRRLRLTGDRYTLGTAEGCSIRLHDSDLLPMHAVLTNAESVTRICAHSEPVEVNQRRVTEAELSPGDSFTLGRFQFELIRVSASGSRQSESGSQMQQEGPAPEDSLSGSELCRRLNETTHQVQLSQQQAQSATQAAKHAQAEIAAFHLKVEKLSEQQNEFANRERSHRREHDDLEETLKKVRDEAVGDSVTNQSSQDVIDKRLKQHEHDLKSLRVEFESRLVSQQEIIETNASVAASLQQQVRGLQGDFNKASEKSERMLQDYAKAIGTIREIETRIDSTISVRQTSHESGESGSGELQESVAQLSSELQVACQRLNQLHEANLALNTRLDEVQRLQDRTGSEPEKIRTTDLVQSLDQKLAETQEQLFQLQKDYGASIRKLDDFASSASRTNVSLKQSKNLELVVASKNLADDQVDQFDPEPDFSKKPQAEETRGPSQSAGSLDEMIRQNMDQVDRDSTYDWEDSVFDNAVQTTTSVSPPASWDQERQEEAFKTRWTNDPEGYRIEEIEEDVPDQLEQDDSGEIQSGVNASQSTRDNEFRSEEITTNPSGGKVDDSRIHQSIPTDGEASIKSLPQQGDFEEDDDESIEAYMNRLLSRVGGNASDENRVREIMSVTRRELPVEKTVAKEEVVKSLAPDEPFLPRSRAPERGTSMSAMRELANSSARTAINRSVRMQTRNTQLKGLFSFSCSIGAAVCGGACYYFIPGVMRFLAVAMTTVVAIIYLREGWVLFRDTSRRLKVEQGSKADFADRS